MEHNLLNEGAAAEYICMSVAYLQKARSNGTTGNRTPGPPYLKIGRVVKYRKVDLDSWLLAHRVETRPNLKAVAVTTHPRVNRSTARTRRSR